MKWGDGGIFKILIVLTAVNWASLQFPCTCSILFLLIRIQQGPPSVYIYALYVTEEQNPVQLKYNFLIPAAMSVYLSENTWIARVV